MRDGRTKTERVLELHAKGLDVHQIAIRVGSTPHGVESLLWKARRRHQSINQ